MAADEKPRGGLFGNAYLVLALASLCWSGNHLLGRAIAGHVPPLTISTLRWLLAALILYPFVRPHLAQDWPQIRNHFGVLIYLSLIGGGVFGALQFIGLQLTTALNVSVMNSLGPLTIAAALLAAAPTALAAKNGAVDAVPKATVKIRIGHLDGGKAPVMSTVPVIGAVGYRL